MQEEVKNNVENKEENKNNNSQVIAGAIIVAGVIIAGAILLSGSKGRLAVAPTADPAKQAVGAITPVSDQDRTLGDPKAKVTLVIYEDFQCPWCGKFENESEQLIRKNYVADGRVRLVYRDFAFLGGFVQPPNYVEAKDESINAAEAARCAQDQGKFWEYHDYLFSHQNGENRGNFSLTNLKSFAKILGLDTSTFNQCMDTNKYVQAVKDAKLQAQRDGVKATPNGFIMKDGKVVDTIEGYLLSSDVLAKIDAALK